MTQGVVIQPLDAGMAGIASAMTFPAYRHLLSMQPQPRHPEQGDSRIVQPFALAARRGDALLGLALAELTDVPAKNAELLSVLVAPEGRGQGIATSLVEQVEVLARARGAAELRAVYMTGKPAIPLMERIFWKRGFEAPQARTVTLRFTPQEALETPWFKRVKLGPEFSVFPWTDLGASERDALVSSNATTPWVTPGLEAWRHDRNFDAVSSLGLRRRGEIVGWVINHEIEKGVVRFTCSYMGYGLGRRGRIMPLYTEALERLRAASCRFCTFVTPVTYRTMVEFVKKRCAPWASFFGETRGVVKKLP